MTICLKSKMLVLGGTGHLGSSLVHYLVREEQVPPKNIRIFYLQGTSTNSLSDIEGLDFFPGDILSKELVEKAMEKRQLIFHMVGNTSFDPKKKKIQWLVNVEGTRNVLSGCESSPTFEKLVYTSTVNTLALPDPQGTLGNEKCDPYMSSSALKVHSFSNKENALDFAGKVSRQQIDNWEKKIDICYYDSKLAAQELVNQAVNERGLNAVSVLPGTMFGPYDVFIGNGMYINAVYQNRLPGVLPGGLPLAHVKDVARGHVRAAQKAKKGARLILSGKDEDNKTLLEMVRLIADVIKEKEPNKKIKSKFWVFKPRVAKIGAWFSEQFTKIVSKPCPLSTASVTAGSKLSWYTSKLARESIGYEPLYSFKTAVEEMFDYYKAHNLLGEKARSVDK